MDVAGKGVFLTGGARGLGRALAEAFLSKGARVLFCDINESLGQSTETELRAQYGAENVTFRKCDVSDAGNLEAVFQEAINRLGVVDISINNAGICDKRVWEKEIAVNLMGQIRGCELALQHMRRDLGGQGGIIINVSSVNGTSPHHYFPVYNATKHGLVGYTTSYAKNPQNKEWGVSWLCFCPGGMYTEMTKFEAGQVYDMETLRTYVNTPSLMFQVSEMVEEFMKMLGTMKPGDVIYEVRDRNIRGRYRKRLLVDSDGVSSPLHVDELDL